MHRTKELQLRAEQAYKGNRFDEAEAACRELQRLDPGNLAAAILRGMIACRTGEQDQAVSHLSQAARAHPNCYEAWLWLGIASRERGDHRGAVTAFEAASRLRPASEPPLLELARSLAAARDISAALAALDRAAAIDPDPPRAIAAFANYLLELSYHSQAIDLFRRCHSLEPESPRGRIQLARALREEGRLEEAKAALLQVLDQDPISPDPLEAATTILQQMGLFEDAARGLDKALKLDPNRARLYFNRISCRRVTADDGGVVDRMLSLVGKEDSSADDLRHLHYALGKAFNDLGNLPQAASHYEKANEAMRGLWKGPKFDRAIHSREFDLKISTFTSEFFGRHASLGNPSELPVLILGMIRSGTSLVEQILSSHRQIAGGGELPFWFERSRGLIGPGVGRDRKPLLPPAFERLQSDYLELLTGIGPGFARVTDKMPYNYMFVGNIHLAFPNARFIHCRRHPVDNCLSIYMTPYRGPLDFAHDKANIVFAYREYMRLMDHWRSVIPRDRLLEVQYEELVEHPEAVTRQMVDFCGTEWDPACLRPDENSRAVKTPSMWQVRQPIYKSSSQRWRLYEPWLGEFAELLEDQPEPASSR